MLLIHSQIQNEIYYNFWLIVIHWALLVASRVKTMLLPVWTVFVTIRYPILLFYSKYLLFFKHKPSDRNSEHYSYINTLRREVYLHILHVYFSFPKNKQPVSWINSTPWNTCSIAWFRMILVYTNISCHHNNQLHLVSKRHFRC